MSLLQAIHAATTLAAVKDLLATEVLTSEDLATADVYLLSEAIRSKGAAVCIFTHDDLDDRFDGTPVEAVTWLKDNASRIGDRMSEQGNQVIDDLLAGDGRLKDAEDDEDDEIDEVEALIYGDTGHPSRQTEGARTAFYSERGGYWYVDEVQGGERYTIIRNLSEEDARAVELGADLSDYEWTLKRAGCEDVPFNSYEEAFAVANGGAAIPYRIVPPLAERDPTINYEGEG